MDDQRAEAQDANETEPHEKCGRRFVLRYYRVWNLEQCELPERALEKLPKIEMHEHDSIDAVEGILAGMPNAPAIEHAGSKAFYSSITDRVTIPRRNLFISAGEYSATLLHELTHSTGHEKRLARERIREAAAFGSAVYSKEELIAEMGGAYLCAEAGISPAVIDNQASYIAGWLKHCAMIASFLFTRPPRRSAPRTTSSAEAKVPDFFGARASRERRSPGPDGTFVLVPLRNRARLSNSP